VTFVNKVDEGLTL